MSNICDAVLGFFAEWRTVPTMRAAIARRFTAETVWENVGIARTVGPEEASTFGKALFGDLAVARIDVLVHHIAVTGNCALTERTDIFYDSSGDEILAMRLMGILEMDGSTILAWRDYFDVNSLGSQVKTAPRDDDRR